MATIKSYFCEDCSETYILRSSTIRCLVCGNPFKDANTRVSADSNENVESGSDVATGLDGLNGNSPSFQYMSELLGSDLFVSIESLINARTSQQLSPTFLNSLGKITVDSNFLILYDMFLQIGTLKIAAIPAEFFPLNLLPSASGYDPPTSDSPSVVSTTVSVSSGPLVMSNPECGNSDTLHVVHQSSMIVMKRGVTTFASKAMLAQQCKASCLIVGQTYETWPFVMTDSSQELSNKSNFPSLSIPVVMVSSDDYKHIASLIRSAELRLPTSTCTESKQDSEPNNQKFANCHVKHVLCGLHVGPRVVECSICQDNFAVGQQILKLYCRHVFHSVCILSWLERSTSCPLCRHDITAKAISAETPITTRPMFVPHTTASDPNLNNSTRQPYFV